MNINIQNFIATIANMLWRSSVYNFAYPKRFSSVNYFWLGSEYASGEYI